MHLRSDNHIFWLDIDTTTWSDSIEIQIGNSNSQLCLSVFDDEVILQDLIYYDTWSIDKQNEMKTETIEMLHAAFKAVLHAFPTVTKIVFADKSYYPHPILGNFPIPEYTFFVYGKTWFQEYFGAIPHTRTQRILNKYSIARNWTLSNNTTVWQYMLAEKKRMMEKDIHNLREKLGLPLLTGTQWEINRSVVEQYPTVGVFEQGQLGGRKPRQSKVERYIPRVH